MLSFRLGILAVVAGAAVSLPAAVSSRVSQTSPTPSPQKILATHPVRGEGFITEYVVEWKRPFLGPGPEGNWQYIWTKRHPPGTDCGKFSGGVPKTASWEHFHPPCPENHPHPAHIHVWFGTTDIPGIPDEFWECIGLYEFGSAAGFGREEPKCTQRRWTSSRPDVPEEIAADRRIEKRAWSNASWAWGAAAAAATGAALNFPPAAGPLGGFIAFSGAMAIMLDRMARDPPDPRFRVIAQPRRAAVPRVRSGPGVSQAVAAALNRFVVRTAELEALLRAHLTSLERAWGAANARELLWMRRQQEAAARHAEAAAAVSRSLPALRLRLARALRASRSSLVAAAAFREAQRQIARRGIPAALEARLRRAGMSAAQLRGIRREAARLPVAGGFPALLTSPRLAAADRETARRLMRYVTAVYS